MFSFKISIINALSIWAFAFCESLYVLSLKNKLIDFSKSIKRRWISFFEFKKVNQQIGERQNVIKRNKWTKLFSRRRSRRLRRRFAFARLDFFPRSFFFWFFKSIWWTLSHLREKNSINRVVKHVRRFVWFLFLNDDVCLFVCLFVSFL